MQEYEVNQAHYKRFSTVTSYAAIVLMFIGFFIMRNQVEINKSHMWLTLLIVGVTFITLHELLHFIPAKLFKYNAKLKIKSVFIEEEIRLNHFYVIALLPVIVTTTIYTIGLVLSLLYFQSTIIIFIAAVALSISGGTKDMYIAYIAYKTRDQNKTGTIKMSK